MYEHGNKVIFWVIISLIGGKYESSMFPTFMPSALETYNEPGNFFFIILFK